jgi:hypothetical protein
MPDRNPTIFIVRPQSWNYKEFRVAFSRRRESIPASKSTKILFFLSYFCVILACMNSNIGCTAGIVKLP